MSGDRVKLGKYELRKPWVKYVDIPFETKLYWEIRKSICDDVITEIKEIPMKDANALGVMTMVMAILKRKR
jgi:hypothetical protein